MKEGVIYSWWNNYANHIKKIVLPADNSERKYISYWRNETFCNILMYLTPISIIAIIPSVYMSFRNGIPLLALADILTLAGMLLIMLNRHLDIWQRKLIFIGIGYSISIAVLYYLSTLAVGIMFMLTLTVLTSIIYPYRFAYRAVLVNVIICLVFGVLINSGYVEFNTVNKVGSWIAVSGSVVFLSLLCIESLRLLLEGLEKSINDKIAADDEMKILNKRLQLATKSARMGIWDWDIINDHMTWDDGMYQLYQTDDLKYSSVYIKWLLRLHPDDRDTINAEIQNAIMGIKEYNTEFRIVWADMSIRYIRGTGTVERDNTGRAMRMIGANWDVTDKIKQQEQLIISEANLSAIIENSDAYIYSLDTEFRCVTFNKKVSRAVKYFLDMDIKQGENIFSYLDKVGSKYTQLWKEKYTEALSGSSLWFEIDYSRPDKMLYLSFSINPIREKEKIIGLSCFSRDITEAKKAEIAIRELNEELKSANIQQASILNTLPANIALLDHDGVIMAVNEGWREFSGKGSLQDSNHSIGDNYIALCENATGDDAKYAHDMAMGIRDVISGNVNNHVVEYPCHTPEEQRWFRAEVSPLDRGKQFGVVVAHVNVTKRKLAEIELNELNNSLELKVAERTAELENANKELEAFSYSVSHDLRAPVRSVLGFVKIIKEEHSDSLSEDVKEMFSYIENSNKRMNAIIDDLFVLAKYGKEKLIYSDVDLNALFSVVWDNLLFTSPHHAVLDMEPMPVVHADSSMLQQVVVNILSNAIKYSSKKENPKIKVGFTKKGGTVTVYVKDNGAGFDMQFYDRLFGAFQRLHGISEFEGTGVGLMLTKKIIERHNGEVWAEGKVNEGATFYFSLPMAA